MRFNYGKSQRWRVDGMTTRLAIIKMRIQSLETFQVLNFSVNNHNIMNQSVLFALLRCSSIANWSHIWSGISGLYDHRTMYYSDGYRLTTDLILGQCNIFHWSVVSQLRHDYPVTGNDALYEERLRFRESTLSVMKEIRDQQIAIQSTHLPLDRMTAISQTTFSNVFSWMKKFDFGLKYLWSLFLVAQLIITQYWFR